MAYNSGRRNYRSGFRRSPARKPTRRSPRSTGRASRGAQTLKIVIESQPAGANRYPGVLPRLILHPVRHVFNPLGTC